jgi:AmiR/NasT family two-component response regulator
MNKIVVLSQDQHFFNRVKRILLNHSLELDPSELQLHGINHLIRQKNPQVLIIHQSVKSRNLSVILDYLVTRKTIPIVFIQQTSNFGSIYQVINDLFFIPIEEGKIGGLLEFAVNMGIKLKSEVTVLNKKIMKLEQKLEEERLVVRAKIKLMETNNLTEDEAYRYILKVAMDKRLSKGEVSKEILNL